MPRTLLRSAGAVIAGLVVAMLAAAGVEAMSAVLHPFPPGADPTDLETCRLHVSRYPAGVLLLCGLGWGIGVFASTWVATRLGSQRHVAHGIAVGALLLGAAVTNMAMLPYPLWFWALNLVLFPAATWAGSSLGRARSPVGPTGPR